MPASDAKSPASAKVATSDAKLTPSDSRSDTKLSVSDSKLSASDTKLSASDTKLSPNDSKLRVSDSKLPASDSKVVAAKPTADASKTAAALPSESEKASATRAPARTNANDSRDAATNAVPAQVATAAARTNAPASGRAVEHDAPRADVGVIVRAATNATAGKANATAAAANGDDKRVTNATPAPLAARAVPPSRESTTTKSNVADARETADAQASDDALTAYVDALPPNAQRVDARAVDARADANALDASADARARWMRARATHRHLLRPATEDVVDDANADDAAAHRELADERPGHANTRERRAADERGARYG